MSEFFDPNQPRYKKVGDLPKEEQGGYKDIEGGGFVRNSAVENDKMAEIATRFMRVAGEDIVRTEAESFDKARSRALGVLKKIADSKKFKQGGFRQTLESYVDARDEIQLSPFKKELCDSEEVVREYARIRYGSAIHEMSDRLKNDKTFVLELLNSLGGEEGEIGNGIGWLPDNLAQDMDVIMAAMKTAPVEAFSFVPQNKRNDLDFIITTLTTIEKHYKPNMRQVAMNAMLELVGPETRKNILEKIRIATNLEKRETY